MKTKASKNHTKNGIGDEQMLRILIMKWGKRRRRRWRRKWQNMQQQPATALPMPNIMRPPWNTSDLYDFITNINFAFEIYLHSKPFYRLLHFIGQKRWKRKKDRDTPSKLLFLAMYSAFSSRIEIVITINTTEFALPNAFRAACVYHTMTTRNAVDSSVSNNLKHHPNGKDRIFCLLMCCTERGATFVCRKSEMGSIGGNLLSNGRAKWEINHF